MREEGYKFEERPHVLVSLAVMSRHFRDHVEDFSRRHLIKHRDYYNSFKSDDELEDAKPLRRCARVKAKVIKDHRCYRHELVCIIFSSVASNVTGGVRSLLSWQMLSNAVEDAKAKCFPNKL